MTEIKGYIIQRDNGVLTPQYVMRGYSSPHWTANCDNAKVYVSNCGEAAELVAQCMKYENEHPGVIRYSYKILPVTLNYSVTIDAH